MWQTIIRLIEFFLNHGLIPSQKDQMHQKIVIMLTKSIFENIKRGKKGHRASRFLFTGCLKKMRCSFCLISPLKSILEGWEIFNLKGDIHSFVFRAISGSRDISKTKLHIKLEELEILSNLAEIFTRKYWPCRTKKIPEQR